MKRLALILTLCFLGTFLIGTNVYAQVPDNVQKAAQQGLKQFIPTLIQEKDHYNLSTTDNINNATLGEGIPYYRVSNSALDAFEAGKKKPTSKDLYVSSDGYIYPIEVGNKSIGIAFVQNINGSWQMVQVSAYPSFEQDLKSANDQVKNALGSQNSQVEEKFVCDPSYGLWGVSVSGSKNEFMVPLRTNNELGLKQNVIGKFDDNLAKLSTFHKNKKSNTKGLAGGGSGTDIGVQVQKQNLLYGGVILIFLISGGIFSWRKLVHNHK